MKLLSLLSSALVFLAAVPPVARATDINFDATLTTSSPLQFGRLSRNGIQQTWTGAESYPGIINVNTRFSYQVYTFSGTLFTGANYIEISAFDPLATGAVFVSAYQGTYNPASDAIGWLGDEGGSGNYYGATDARFFDVFLPFGQNLTIVVNSSSTAGLNDPTNIDISSYGDTSYGPAIPTPEPASFVLLGTGLAGIATALRRRAQATARP